MAIVGGYYGDICVRIYIYIHIRTYMCVYVYTYMDRNLGLQLLKRL